MEAIFGSSHFSASSVGTVAQRKRDGQCRLLTWEPAFVNSRLEERRNRISKDSELWQLQRTPAPKRRSRCSEACQSAGSCPRQSGRDGTENAAMENFRRPKLVGCGVEERGKKSPKSFLRKPRSGIHRKGKEKNEQFDLERGAEVQRMEVRRGWQNCALAHPGPSPPADANTEMDLERQFPSHRWLFLRSAVGRGRTSNRPRRKRVARGHRRPGQRPLCLEGWFWSQGRLQALLVLSGQEIERGGDSPSTKSRCPPPPSDIGLL